MLVKDRLNHSQGKADHSSESPHAFPGNAFPECGQADITGAGPAHAQAALLGLPPLNPSARAARGPLLPHPQVQAGSPTMSPAPSRRGWGGQQRGSPPLPQHHTCCRSVNFMLSAGRPLTWTGQGFSGESAAGRRSMFSEAPNPRCPRYQLWDVGRSMNGTHSPSQTARPQMASEDQSHGNNGCPGAKGTSSLARVCDLCPGCAQSVGTCITSSNPLIRPLPAYWGKLRHRAAQCLLAQGQSRCLMKPGL